MAIEEMQTVVVARVEVTDEYRVELAQLRRVTEYSPDQAVMLASDLIDAAVASKRMQREQAERAEFESPRTPSGEAVL